MTVVRAMELQASSDMYSLLRLFMRRPERDLVTAITSGALTLDVFSILKDIGLPTADAELVADKLQVKVDSEEELEDLFHRVRKDYTHLFSNPSFSVVRIHESEFLNDGSYRDTRNINLNSIARDVRSCYMKLDETVRPAMTEQPDHMDNELAYMASLRALHAAALNQHDEKSVAVIAQEAETFFRRHLAVWGKDFFAAVERESKECVYQTVGKLGQVFMKTELGQR
ncbi:molecular chaperone [Eggerthella sp. YY7918]|uniref:TorD/DmsD family molecular chaperone n=1 Tax=Eggerthella sp. (strain YY7918) TaxID=502558 RepID=UPI0002171456|nr:molecular chaperone TorD family protein [Eggerthella sp. YY7918]BAK44866.1 hypothetical protein EGYY_17260 [Eggerthella sp. YY7918]